MKLCGNLHASGNEWTKFFQHKSIKSYLKSFFSPFENDFSLRWKSFFSSWYPKANRLKMLNLLSDIKHVLALAKLLNYKYAHQINICLVFIILRLYEPHQLNAKLIHCSLIYQSVFYFWCLLSCHVIIFAFDCK